MKSTTKVFERTPRLIAITGGIASGKSFVCSRLEATGHRVFYCDNEAKHIIRTDPEVKEALCSLVGKEVYNKEGGLNKAILAAYLCRGKEYAARVDSIVHPRVAEAFRQIAKEIPSAQQNLSLPRQLSIETLSSLPPKSTLFMECALLFESGFDRLVDCSVLVSVSDSTRLRRLMKRDGITQVQAEHWMALQMTEAEKLRRADCVIDNEMELTL